MYPYFVTSLFKKATAKLHGFQNGFLKLPKQYGENFTTSVQIMSSAACEADVC